MSKAIDNLIEAMNFAQANRPRVGGFPYLAEVLRKAGATRNVWSLPSCQPLLDPGRTCCHAGRAFGQRRRRCTALR